MEDEQICQAWFQAAYHGSVDELKHLLTLHPNLLNYCDRYEVIRHDRKNGK